MIGAKIFNKNEGNDISFIYGCVTTGETWQFLKLENDVVMMDTNRYYINELGKLLSILKYIIDIYNE